MTRPVPPARARARRPSPGGVGLALAGGGPLGGIYEVGALLALDDSIDGLDVNALDVYVGVSSGGFVAAALANGLSPAQMYKLFIAEGREAAMKPHLFRKPALREFVRRAGTLPRLAAEATALALRDPFRRGLHGSLATLSRAMPTGVFDQRALDAFLCGLFAAPGRTNDFRRLRRKLLLVATNLDTGASVAFGAPGFDHVPISRAIEASSALPGLYPPVAIEGRQYVDGALNKTLHASLALDAGVELLFCVNPLVPFDASAGAPDGRLHGAALDHGGLPRVLAQTFRAFIHSRMHAGLEKYARQYPRASIVLLEPARADADMFMASIFSYAERERLCARAYDTTRASLLARSGELAPLLARHGLALRHARLRDGDRRVAAALNDPRPLRASPRRRGVRHAARELAHTLDHLERHLAALR
jgi:predicted acylesterase/phospholipase RssA